MAIATPVSGVPMRPRRRARRLSIALACLIALALGGFGYWWLHRGQVSTDDAFVDGDVVGIAPQVAGRVKALHFKDNEAVTAGQLLLEIDPRDLSAAQDRAQANLDAATAARQSAEADLAFTRASTAADLQLAQAGVTAAEQAVQQAQAQADAAKAESERAAADLPRVQSLFERKFNSAQQLDQSRAIAQAAAAQYIAAQRAVDTARAQVSEAGARLMQAQTAPQQLALKEAALARARADAAEARAQLETARLNLSYTEIKAPAGGRIARRAVNIGNMVDVNQTLAELVIGRPWITANFKETQLTAMRPGQPVRIAVDTYPDRPFRGRVDSIQPGTGARFSLLPPENATGNFVKVVQRVPVKILFEDGQDIDRYLALGMSVVPTVNVAAGASPETAPDAAAMSSAAAAAR